MEAVRKEEVKLRGEGKINEAQRRALCYRVLYNHIRQRAPIFDADANSLVMVVRLRAGRAHAVTLGFATRLVLHSSGDC